LNHRLLYLRYITVLKPQFQMAQTSLAHNLSPKKSSESGSALDRVRETHTQELIFGICSPIGTKRDSVIRKLKSLIENDYGYECEVIKLSTIIDENWKEAVDHPMGTKEYERCKTLILKGNKLREKYSPSILAEIAVKRIGMERLKEAKGKNVDDTENPLKFKSRRKCYIIDSIKNLEEYKLFKAVYRELFYFFSIYSPLNERIHYLGKNKGLKEKEIFELIDQDSGEEIDHGQDVVNTFTYGDFFFRKDEEVPQILDNKLRRYLHLIFDTAIVTPTIDEKAMYAAKVASYNSGCLSRQVGACITDYEGEVISTGWNDVPKFGGGLYASDKNNPLESGDKRCKNLDGCICFNDRTKKELSEQIAKELLDKKILSELKLKEATEVLNKSRIKSLIEFARSIHAEMHAIILGSQKTGSRMVNGKLFCTTYPCHNCARHIVVAGIKEVYYIEPYRKSMGIELHFDSLTEDENDKEKVRILMFDGVSPQRYNEVFEMRDNRKNAKLPLKEAEPKYSISLQALFKLESLATRTLPEEF